MSRPVLFLAFAALLAPGFVLADKTTVYKTTNADGTTSYSQIESTNAQQQSVDGRDPNVPAAAAAETPKSDMEKACDNATTNLNLFNSGKKLQRDKDKDGTLEDLTPEEIASEKDLAQRQVTAFCPPAAAETK